MNKANEKYVKLEHVSKALYQSIDCNDNSLSVLAEFLCKEIFPGLPYDVFTDWLKEKYKEGSLSGLAYALNYENEQARISFIYDEEDDVRIFYYIDREELLDLVNRWYCMACIRWFDEEKNEYIPMPKEILIQEINGKVSITADNLIHESEKFLQYLQFLKDDKTLKLNYDVTPMKLKTHK